MVPIMCAPNNVCHLELEIEIGIIMHLSLFFSPNLFFNNFQILRLRTNKTKIITPCKPLKTSATNGRVSPIPKADKMSEIHEIPYNDEDDERCVREDHSHYYWNSLLGKNIIFHEINPHPSQKITVNTASIYEETKNNLINHGKFITVVKLNIYFSPILFVDQTILALKFFLFGNGFS